MRWFRSQRDASRFAEDASRALRAGRLDEAREGYRQAIELGANSSNNWFNLGLVEKLARNWDASVASNRRAAELDRGNHEAHWNLGVAATALRDWPTARWAWQGLGFDVGNDGPPNGDFGHAPVRLNATNDGEGEVVWSRRLDPCRARLVSVPLPESGHRFGDVVLHDVVPRGERKVGDQVYAVFDELIRMDPSALSTHEIQVTSPTKEDMDDLIRRFVETDLGAEDWSSIKFICSSCSLASAHRHEDKGPASVWEPQRRVGMGATSADVERLIGAWVTQGRGREAGAPRQVG